MLPRIRQYRLASVDNTQEGALFYNYIPGWLKNMYVQGASKKFTFSIAVMILCPISASSALSLSTYFMKWFFNKELLFISVFKWCFSYCCTNFSPNASSQFGGYHGSLCSDPLGKPIESVRILLILKSTNKRVM